MKRILVNCRICSFFPPETITDTQKLNSKDKLHEELPKATLYVILQLLLSSKRGFEAQDQLLVVMVGTMGSFFLSLKRT